MARGQKRGRPVGPQRGSLRSATLALRTKLANEPAKPAMKHRRKKGAEKGIQATQAGGSTESWERALRNSLQQDNLGSDQQREAKAPREVSRHFWVLSKDWLRPEQRTKEQILDQLVLKTFLTLLPQDMQSWVRDCDPETSYQAVALAEGFLLSQRLDKHQEEQVRLLQSGGYPPKYQCLTPTQIGREQ